MCYTKFTGLYILVFYSILNSLKCLQNIHSVVQKLALCPKCTTKTDHQTVNFCFLIRIFVVCLLNSMMSIVEIPNFLAYCDSLV